MKRERRYTIFKHRDIEKYLTEDQIEKLFELESEISFRRQQDGRGLMSGLVIERDWPEFEQAWSLIERRVDLGSVEAIPIHKCTKVINADNDALLFALSDISSMCVGEIAMGYKLDANFIGELIYKATGMTQPELHEYTKKGA
ncbi:hypothetical protein [Cycloclasticus pugetii]|uniref:hypothetical protein n=1 Tax=Cycloclasticus pugetii TaxID=34068 RepID=UPI00240A3379|nr:hypothetical protein [Cycloclasticus pugetii]MDF1830640.1 hypothetical protein [Cycloclasticus pugetii]